MRNLRILMSLVCIKYIKRIQTINLYLKCAARIPEFLLFKLNEKSIIYYNFLKVSCTPFKEMYVFAHVFSDIKSHF